MTSKLESDWRSNVPLLEPETDKNGENPMTFDERDPDNAYLRGQDAIHAHFGLSYASYLVIPRLVLVSMPLAWQRAFVGLIDDLVEELGSDWEPDGGYTVHARDNANRFVEDPWRQYRHGRPRRPKCYDTPSLPSETGS